MARTKGETRAQSNRRIRQEALRDQLANQGHVQHVLDITDELRDLGNELNSTEVQRLRAAADIKLKLIDKYLPSIKPIEITGEEGEAIKVDTTWVVKVVE